MSAAIDRFLIAIGYPLDEVAADAEVVSILVDGMTMKLRENHGAIVLSLTLGRGSEVDVVKIAGYAAGRMLKEEAVVAYDRAADEVFLWQKIGSKASDMTMKRAFELFATSCEWWLMAIANENEGKQFKAAGADGEMRIMP